MELLLTRKTRTEESTIGELSVDGKFECYVIEDKDRGLNQTQSLAIINSAKVFAKTAIPAGRYQVTITMSNHFKKLLPLINNVPGFEGVRIHSGNTAADTEGCLIVGKTKGKNIVGDSRTAFSGLFPKIEAALKSGKVFITIQ